MKHLKFYTTLFLAGLLFPVLSFTQITNDYLLQNSESFPPNHIELLTTEDNRPSPNLRDANDLLLAERGDDWIDNAWVLADSIDYYYNSDNLLVNERAKTFENNAWVDTGWTTYEYDTNGNLILTTSTRWDGSNWVNDSQIIQEYNADNVANLYIYQNGDGNNWINNYQWSYQFNLNDSTAVALREDWDGSTWVNASKSSYTDYYDYSFDYVTLIISEAWNNTDLVWENSVRITQEYGMNNEWTMGWLENWDGTDWAMSIRLTLSYDANLNRTLILREVSAGTAWVVISQSVYEYDMNNNETSFLSQTWNNGAWSDSFGNSSEYDADNNLILRIAQSSDGTSLVNSSRDIYYYQIVSSTSQPKLEHPVQLFPNPANTNLTIDLGDNEILSGQLNIYNMMGHLLGTQPLEGSKQVTLELNGFSAGTYYLQILDGERQTTRTFMVAP